MLGMADLDQLLLRKMDQSSGKKLVPMVKELASTVILIMMARPSLSDTQQERMDSESLKVIMFQKEPMD